MRMDPVCCCAPRGSARDARRVLAILSIACFALLLCSCSNKSGDNAGAPGGGRGGRGGGRGGDVPVAVATATTKDVPVEVEVIGNVEAYAAIGVKAQISGQLTAVHFKEGDYVKKGDLLLSIDSRPLDAALAQATANNARDQAVLGQAQANLARDSANARYLESQAARYAELLQSGVVSKDQAEQIRASADAAAQATVADKAAI